MLGPVGTVPPEAAERTAWLVLRDSGRSHQRGQARRVCGGMSLWCRTLGDHGDRIRAPLRTRLLLGLHLL
jgi:hypothetical protein